ncbi:acyl-CoA dehydrogenase [Streptomyces sp. M10(2022)]
MTIGLTEEHRDLRDTVRTFADRHITPDVLREAVDAQSETLPPYWQGLADQGLLGLHLPEDVGGAGYGLLELAVVIEEFGRAMAPGPFLPSTLAAAVLHRAGHTTHLPALADGTSIAAVGLRPGTSPSPGADGAATVSGEPELVIGGHLAGLFVLPAHDGERISWIVVPRSATRTTDVPSHDLTRRSSRVSLHSAVVPDADVLRTQEHGPLDLAAVLFAAEASGIADRNVSTAVAYARVREQFGRPIGQFQGVKHRCARMLAQSEQARACAWDAARASAPGAVDDPREAALAAAVAGATGVEAAFGTAKDCIQVLGGIGFTWEHDAHLALRRAQTLRIALGPAAEWRRRVARLTLDGARRTGRRTAAGGRERAHRCARGSARPPPWKAGNGSGTSPTTGTPPRTCPPLEGRRRGEPAGHRRGDQGSGADPVDMIIGGWVVPTLIAHGDTAQQEQFLRPSLRGDIVWCQLFSEPGAGSDLAGLSTRAEKTDGGWKVTGQKVWTSMAHDAHWGVLLARTDPTAPKHKGLSYFLLDMKSPGLDIRPLRQITGDAEFNEVFLDEVFIPDELLVSAPGDGWKLARTTLANERVALSHDTVGSGAQTLLEMAAAAPRDLDDERLTGLGAALCDAQCGALLGLRTTLRSVSGQQPGAEASIAKLLGVEHQQQVWEMCVDWQGIAALTGEGRRHDATWMFLNSRCMSIAGGTTEVQLNIIGERLLGLPRDPEPVAAKRG